ncbi:hypothetical protein E2C01_022832 [Portunus trituberculatus]|uniref:Uncharacterized protein n=1 Tax=Portunus trituberculatus TaxID=210409 RepID=A0A5B7E6G1_PORTR|nr:hypothetical protein [Portunus trituberculatus]
MWVPIDILDRPVSQLVRVAGQHHLCVPPHQARQGHQHFRLHVVPILVQEHVCYVAIGRAGQHNPDDMESHLGTLLGMCCRVLVQITLPAETHPALQTYKVLRPRVCDCVYIAVALPDESLATVEALVAFDPQVDQDVFVEVTVTSKRHRAVWAAMVPHASVDQVMHVQAKLPASVVCVRQCFSWSYFLANVLPHSPQRQSLGRALHPVTCSANSSLSENFLLHLWHSVVCVECVAQCLVSERLCAKVLPHSPHSNTLPLE